MNVEIRENDIRITTDKETAAKLGARYVKGNLFQLPKTIHAVRDLLKYSNHIELKPLYEKMFKTRTLILSKKKREDITEGFSNFMPKLRPYQRVDVAFLNLVPHAGIFNQQRTGKTPTFISLVKLKDFQKVVIVVPAGLMLSWKKEVEQWHGDIKVFAIRGTKKQREKLYQTAYKHDKVVFIISYDTLKIEGELTTLVTATHGSFDALAVDEAHNIRNNKSQRTKAIKDLGKYADHRYALTGTPAVKNGYEIWSILNFLYPKKFSSYWGFLERYFEMKPEFFSGTMQPTGKYIRQEELEDILALISTNRKRSEVMAWLPDKTYQTIPLDLTQKQRKAYDQVLEEFVYQEEGETLVNASGVLAQLTRLRQICLAPSILGIKAPSAKEQFILEWLEDNQEPVIIFSQFTSYLKELGKTLEEKRKEKVVFIHGELTGKQKQESVQAFQQGNARILLANINAAGTGFTLDRAETTIFLDKAWNPSDNIQAEDRMVPVSKERNHKMTVISLVASDTYDEKMDLLLEHKHNITEVINSGGLRALDRLYKELNRQ